MDIVNSIIEFESGEMDGQDTIEFFAELISSGTCWSLQGSYGRSAMSLIESGLVSDKGVIDWGAVNELEMEGEI